MKFLYLVIALCCFGQVVPAQNYKVSKPPIDGTITIAKPHPILKCDLGADIQRLDVQSDSNTVYNIVEGEVTACLKIGGVFLVMVQCDSLFYIYSNLKNTFVQKHQRINTNAPIGELETDDDGKKYSLTFSVWDNQKPYKELPIASLLKILKAKKK